MPVLDAHPDMERDLRFFPVTNPFPRRLTSARINDYNERGYIFPLELFTEKEAEANRDYFDRFMAKAEAAGLDSYSINGWHRYCSGIYDLVMEDRILDYVEDIIGSDIVCTMTHYFCKTAPDLHTVYWHQDASFWPLTPSKVVTVWLAIDDTDKENGAMQVVPGTHLRDRLAYELVSDEQRGVLSQSVPHPEQFGDPISIELKAGQISLHTDMLLHGSQPNPSSRRRCGLTIRYFPVDVRTKEESLAEGIICRGSDPTGYWQNLPRPDGDNLPPAEVVEERARVVAEKRRGLQ